MIRSVRELTPKQREIAIRIGRGLKYDDIAKELGLSGHTVRAHVRHMANLIDIDDEGELTPRERILLLVKHEEWERTRARGAKEA